MKTTFDLPEDLVREVKLRAVLQGRTVKDLIAELLRQGLGMACARSEKTPASHMVKVGENGLPVIRCVPDAPATRMSIEELLKLERDSQSQEDLSRAGIAL
jgi:plasmid stability protein